MNSRICSAVLEGRKEGRKGYFCNTLVGEAFRSSTLSLVCYTFTFPSWPLTPNCGIKYNTPYSKSSNKNIYYPCLLFPRFTCPATIVCRLYQTLKILYVWGRGQMTGVIWFALIACIQGHSGIVSSVSILESFPGDKSLPTPIIAWRRLEWLYQAICMWITLHKNSMKWPPT